MKPPALAVIAVLATLLLGIPAPATADTREDQLFAPAAAAREQAESAQSALLAPGAYGKGVAAFERARSGYRGGAAEEEVGKRLAEAQAAFIAATRAAGEARRTLAEPLARREAAREAEAFRLAGPTWIRAENALTAAAQRLEKTDVEGALKRSAEAALLYSDAELQAIKSTLLGEARRAVAAMDAAGVDRDAPQAGARARGLLGRAEAELDADRTRRDAAAALAAEAVRESAHATAAASWLAAARERKATPEDLLAEWEAAVARVAAAAGIEADFTAGPRAAGDAVATAVGSQRTELADRGRQVAALEDEIRELDGRLAGASSEARSLAERLEVRERARAQFEQVEKAFPTDQAVVFRQGDTIIVRLQAIAFASGSSKLPAAAEPLLGKIREVTAVYPRAIYTVEGHTDSSGDSGANQRLSQARADAVRAWMVAQLALPAGRVSAVGYGDSRLIAKNESAEGRRQNRRIDLVIDPREKLAP